MELILKTPNIDFRITKHNPEHPTIKNQLSFEAGDIHKDMVYNHDIDNHYININTKFHNWQLINVTDGKVIYDGVMISTLTANLKDPEPYNDDGFIHEDEISYYGTETIGLDNITLYLAKSYIQFCFPSFHYDIDYKYHLGQVFDRQSIHYDSITGPSEITRHFGDFNDFRGFDVFFRNYDADWIIDYQFKVLGLDDFIKNHEFITDNYDNKVWITKELGCKQFSSIKLALDIPDPSLDQMIGLDEVFESCSGIVNLNIKNIEQNLDLKIEMFNGIPRMVIYKKFLEWFIIEFTRQPFSF